MLKRIIKRFIDSQDSTTNSKIVLALFFAMVLTVLVAVHILGIKVDIQWGWLLGSLIAGLLAVDKIPQGFKGDKPN